MSSTLGHALCGVACLLAARAQRPRATLLQGWRGAAAFVLLANLPDLDFVIGYLLAGDVHRFHSGASHSLLAALLLGLLLGRFAPAGERGPLSIWICTALASHVLVDLFAGPGFGQPSYGVPLLWPLLDERIRMPFSLFLGVQHATWADLLGWRNVQVVAVETIVFGLPVLLLRRYTQSRKGRTSAIRGSCEHSP